VKKLVLALAALAVLALAGAAGAVVSGKIFHLKIGQQAHVAGTGVYCLVEKSTTGFKSFDCASTDGGPRPGSYGAFINDAGLVVYRYGKNGSFKKVKTYQHGE